MIEELKNVRRCGVPLLVIKTPDQINTLDVFIKYSTGEFGFNVNDVDVGDKDVPILVWDAINKLVGKNKSGLTFINNLANRAGESDMEALTDSPPRLIKLVDKYLTEKPEDKVIIVMLNAHRYVKEPESGGDIIGIATIQGIMNIRDKFPANRRMLVLLCPDIKLPAEIEKDFIVLDEPYPAREEIQSIIESRYNLVKQKYPNTKMPDKQRMSKLVSASTGLPAFSIRQITSLSTSKEGVNLDKLRELNYSMIGQTPGLSIYRGEKSLFKDSVTGLESIISYAHDIKNGRRPPQVIGFFDEIEKAGLKADGDSNNIGADVLRCFLINMQELDIPGLIFIGGPGTGKSLVAKTLGTEMDIPTIMCDVGGMRDKWVGSSEQMIRNAFKTIMSVGDGRALFIATCNSITSLPPELKRRFYMGTFFFDIPTEKEILAIFRMYYKKYGFNEKKHPFPDYKNWTGNEAYVCCKMAYELNSTPQKIASRIVPVYKHAYKEIQALREMAHERYLSASYDGFYVNPTTQVDLNRREISV